MNAKRSSSRSRVLALILILAAVTALLRQLFPHARAINVLLGGNRFLVTWGVVFGGFGLLLGTGITSPFAIEGFVNTTSTVLGFGTQTGFVGPTP